MNASLIDPKLRTLARFVGIQLKYTDFSGQVRQALKEQICSILESLGYNTSTEEAIEKALGEEKLKLCRRVIPPVVFVDEGSNSISFFLTIAKNQIQSLTAKSFPIFWALSQEKGPIANGRFFIENETKRYTISLKEGFFFRFKITLPVSLPLGYHNLALKLGSSAQNIRVTTLVICAPRVCYLPESLAKGGKYWGISTQLYNLSSGRNWGIGDFSDLREVVSAAGKHGAAFVGISPLHSQPLFKPGNVSPYSPSSRAAINPLFVAVDAVPGFFVKETFLKLNESTERLRNTKLIEYEEVANLKLTALNKLFDDFLINQSSLNFNSSPNNSFKFNDAIVLSSDGYAIFETLREHLFKQNNSFGDWRNWPVEFRDKDNNAISQFIKTNGKRVRFYKFVQWVCDSQLKQVRKEALAHGLSLGLYGDLALGSEPGGFDVWRNQELYALQINVGAPPDYYNEKGQDWGFPPFIPRQLKDVAYKPFVESLQFNMRYLNMIRLDHAMSIERLFWIPSGKSGADGLYVRYPRNELLKILALESIRNKCVIIGEDLGTVPEHFRNLLHRWNIFSYTVFIFMRDWAGNFLDSGVYQRFAIVTTTTHDMPTIWGWWLGLDHEIRLRSGLDANKSLESLSAGRKQELEKLLCRLNQEGLLPPNTDVPHTIHSELSYSLFLAIEKLLSKSPSQLLAVGAEDIFEVKEQVNLPGVTDAYASWKNRHPYPVELWANDERLQLLASALNLERSNLNTLQTTV